MRDEVMETGFNMIFALVVFALAIGFSYYTLSTNSTFNKWVAKEVNEKQLVVEGVDYDYDASDLTVGEVIEELKGECEIDVYINGSLIDKADLEKARNDVELFSLSPFSFITGTYYEKEYECNNYGEIIAVHYTLK